MLHFRLRPNRPIWGAEDSIWSHKHDGHHEHHRRTGRAAVKSGIAIYDVGAGLTAIYSILAAVCINRKRRGQHIDISLAECGLPWFVWEAAAYFAEGTVPQATGSRHRVSAPYQAFNTRNGYIIIGAANQRTWESLCIHVLERPDLINDPRFATNSDRMAMWKLWRPFLRSVLAG